MRLLELKLKIDSFLLTAGDTTVYGTTVAAAMIYFIGIFGSLPLTHTDAAFEQVGHYAGSPTPVSPPFAEEVQLGGVGGMAVNYTGVGGVPQGTVYVATEAEEQPRVAMFVPDGEELKFELSWEVTELPEPLPEPYERCGPSLGVDGEGHAENPCPPLHEGPPGRVDVEIDKATGNVFVLGGTHTRDLGRKTIVIYDADGSEEVSRFGEFVSGTITESPAKIHGLNFPGGLAINNAGEIYVFDSEILGPSYRLAKFKPKTPGSLEYEYAGIGEDVATGTAGHRPTLPVMDSAGHIFVASESAFIEMYDPGQSKNAPVCTFEYKKGGITAITVDPLSGHVFFFSSRKEAGFAFKTVHELGPCNEATHTFTEVGQFEVSPERDNLWGLAFDPMREFSPGRDEGTLYGGAPGPVPPLGFGLGEPGQSSLGYIFAPLEESPPTIGAETVSKAASTTVRLSATIDPGGFKTHYAFQYLTEAEFEQAGESFGGAAEAPAGGAFLTSSGVSEVAGVTLNGLSPDTEFRFRVVATSNGCPAEPEELCVSTGSPQRFHTYPFTPAGLPDSRAYELVSPADKGGGQVFPADPRMSSCGSETDCKPGVFGGRFPMQSAPDGSSIAYEGSAFGQGGASSENAYIARRTSTGWGSVNPTPTVLRSKGGAGYWAFAEDLQDGLVAQESLQPTLSPSAPSEYENLYAQPTASPFGVTPLVATQPGNRGPLAFRVTYTGASSDLSRIFFTANDALTGEVPGTAPAAVDGGAAKLNLYEWERATGQLRLVNVAPGNTATEAGAAYGTGSAHAISDDGSRAFWSDATGKLFVREDAQSTREIPGSGPGAGFLAASRDGSKVLLSNGHLYNLENEVDTDLTAGLGGFLGVVGQSENLARIYFIDTKVLTGGAESCREGVAGEIICEKAQANKPNLYSWNEGAVSFVATLAVDDNGGGSFNLTHTWDPVPSHRTAAASPAGRYLAFQSLVPLTGFDSTGPCEPDHANGYVEAACPEVFLYDSATGEVVCPSCNPTGAAPLGWSLLRRLPGGDWLPQPRYIFDSGRFFFDSQDSLSPLDTNEGVEDVYEFEPSGVGGCGRDAGCLSLISAGREEVDSNFFAADLSGANVFFTSRDRLVAADKDELIDLYDAREGGGIPPLVESPPGEPPLPPPPAEPTPATPTFQDPGNVKTTKTCKKGQVKRKGKCVKKHSKSKSKKSKSRRGGHR